MDKKKIERNLDIINDLVNTSILALKEIDITECHYVITTLNATYNYYEEIMSLLNE